MPGILRGHGRAHPPQNLALHPGLLSGLVLCSKSPQREPLASGNLPLYTGECRQSGHIPIIRAFTTVLPLWLCGWPLGQQVVTTQTACPHPDGNGDQHTIWELACTIGSSDSEPRVWAPQDWAMAGGSRPQRSLLPATEASAPLLGTSSLCMHTPPHNNPLPGAPSHLSSPPSFLLQVPSLPLSSLHSTLSPVMDSL